MDCTKLCRKGPPSKTPKGLGERGPFEYLGGQLKVERQSQNQSRKKEAWVSGMSAISRSDGSTRSVDTKMAYHVTKAVGEMKHGAVSSKRRRVHEAESGIASHHSSLNPGCFRKVWDAFATWSGALSRLGLRRFRGFVWGAFEQGLGRFRDSSRGAFRSTQGKEKGSMRGEQEKQNLVHRNGCRARSRAR